MDDSMQLIFSLHTPEQLRMLSNWAHWIEGAIFLTAALILLLKVTGRIQSKKADLLWPGLILGAGVFLILYIFFHHPLNQLPLVWQVILVDPQQRQHMIMAILLVLVSLLQLLYLQKKIRSPLIPFAWPAVLVVIGIFFVFHPQHGTPEAIAYMKPYHTALGIVIILTGTAFMLSILKDKNKLLHFFSIGLLALAAFLLLFYREPAGSYQMDMQTDEMERDNTPISHGGPVVDYVSLIDMLRSKGATVTPQGEVSQELFSMSGNAILVNRANVQVFTFGSELEAKTQAEQINPDGSGTKTMMITWVEPPHFYRKGKIIVLYVGSDPETISLLEQVLGEQFAGR